VRVLQASPLQTQRQDLCQTSFKMTSFLVHRVMNNREFYERTPASERPKIPRVRTFRKSRFSLQPCLETKNHTLTPPTFFVRFCCPRRASVPLNRLDLCFLSVCPALTFATLKESTPGTVVLPHFYVAISCTFEPPK